MEKDRFGQIVCDGDDGCNDDDGGDDGGDYDMDDGGDDGGGKPVSVVALVFQESRERRRPVVGTELLALTNYNQFATQFPQTG